MEGGGEEGEMVLHTRWSILTNQRLHVGRTNNTLVLISTIKPLLTVLQFQLTSKKFGAVGKFYQAKIFFNMAQPSFFYCTAYYVFQKCDQSKEWWRYLTGRCLL